MTRSIAPAAVRIRRATRADAEVVHRLAIELAAAVGQADQVTAEPATWRAALDRDDVVCFLAEADERVMAYASTIRHLNLWRGREVLTLDDIYVRVEARNQGVGRRLMLAVARLAEADGVPVFWGAEAGNVDALRFYGRLGATLRPKMRARWEPNRYRGLLASADRPGS